MTRNAGPRSPLYHTFSGYYIIWISTQAAGTAHHYHETLEARPDHMKHSNVATGAQLLGRMYGSAFPHCWTARAIWSAEKTSHAPSAFNKCPGSSKRKDVSPAQEGGYAQSRPNVTVSK